MPQVIVSAGKNFASLKAIFNQHFPFLKLEYDDLTGASHSLRKLGNKIESIPDDICFDGRTTVRALEKQLLEVFGSRVQVFRKSGKIWLKTTSTDDWTLEQQNEEGKSIAQHLKIETEDPADHDMY